MKKILITVLLFLIAATSAYALDSWQELKDKAAKAGEGGWINKEKDFKQTLADTLAVNHNPDGTHAITASGAEWDSVTGPATYISATSFKVPQTTKFVKGRKVWVDQATDTIGVVESASDAAGETTVVLKSIVLYSDNSTSSTVTSPVSAVAVGGVSPRSAPDTSSARMDTLENNIALNAYRAAVNGSFTAPYSMTDGVGDNFGSESGVDTAASANEIYNAAGDFYTNSDITNYAYTSANNSNGYVLHTATTQEAGNAVTLSANGDISSVKVKLKKYGGPTGNMEVGLYDVSGTPGTDGVPTGTPLATVTRDISTLSTSLQWETFTFASPVSTSGMEVAITVAYTGGGAGVYLYVELDIASTAGSDNAFTTNTKGSGWGPNLPDTRDILYDFDVVEGGLDSTLISNATEAVTEPDDGRIVAFVEPVDAVTLNTDFKCFSSKDDGTTYDQVTLADEGEYETGKNIYTGSVTLSTAGDQTMRVKCSTHNTKEIRIHDWTHLWR